MSAGTVIIIIGGTDNASSTAHKSGIRVQVEGIGVAPTPQVLQQTLAEAAQKYAEDYAG